MESEHVCVLNLLSQVLTQAAPDPVTHQPLPVLHPLLLHQPALELPGSLRPHDQALRRIPHDSQHSEQKQNR